MDIRTLKQKFLLKSYNFDLGTRRQRTIQDTNYVAYINSTRGMEGLIKSLKDELGDKATVEELWLNKREKRVDVNSQVGVIEAYEEEPPIANRCTHVLFVTSDSDKVLEYSKFLINRYMNIYSAVVPTKERIPRKVREVHRESSVNTIDRRTTKVNDKSKINTKKVQKPTSFLQKVGYKLLGMISYWLKQH